MITIKDIAKEANVSVTTVSNVINNNSSRVSEKTIKKIQDIIEKYNYTPNMNARSLVGTSSKIIGVIVPQPETDETSFLSNPFNTEILAGIEAITRNEGYYLMIRCVKSYREIYNLLQNWKVEGVIILGLFQEDFSSLSNIIKTPTVFIDSYIDSNQVINIGLDDEYGAYLSTSHLIENGHENIAYVSFTAKPGGVDEKRRNGYIKAITEHNIPLNNDNLFVVQATVRESAWIEKLVSKIKDNVTAICTSADYIAIELIDILKDHNINIPNDVSIVGFDDLYMSRIITPKLTTIQQDITLKGTLASNLLIDLIKNNKVENKNISLPIKLIQRDSVKNLK